jgi:threonine synthase
MRNSTDLVMNGNTAITPKFVAIAASASGVNVLLAAVAGKKIRVLSYVLVATTAVTAKFQNGATDISGAMPLGATGVLVAPMNILGHFETAVNAALNLTLGSAVAVAGHLTYIEV